MQGHELVSGQPEADLAVCSPREVPRLSHSAFTWQVLQAKRWVGLSLPDAEELSQYRVAIWATDALAPVIREVEDRALKVGETLKRLGAQVGFDARVLISPMR